MQQKLILENWRKFLKEEVEGLEQTAQETEESLEDTSSTKVQPTVQQQQQTIKDTILGSIQNTLTQARQTAESEGVNKSDLQNAIITKVREIVKEAKKKKAKVVKKKSGDRCTRIAKRKYDVWPSAYASGAVVKCRQGKIWKGVSENASDQEIDDALLLEEIEIIEEAKKKDYKPNFSKEKEQGLHGWFARNDGKGWVNCRTGGPCGRDSADKGGKYPACRPTKSQCKSAGKGPLRKKKSSSPISWTKKKKKD